MGNSETEIKVYKTSPAIFHDVKISGMELNKCN
jgi:hypothetical protein